MRLWRSLRVRLFVGAAIVILVALTVAGLSLAGLFTRHLERRIGQELDTHLEQLTSSLNIGTDGALTLTREPVDPRFQKIFGGLYWQVLDQTTGQSLKSRSLWDATLTLPDDTLVPGDTHSHDLVGPQQSVLLAHEQLFTIRMADGDHLLRVTVAIDRSEIKALASGFSRDLALVLAGLGLVLMLGLWAQVTSGLGPIRGLQNAVAAIRSGERQRIAAEEAPPEVVPLVEGFNSLLDMRDAEMVRARDRAADLAHGLKTPLTALASDVERLRQHGETEIADDIHALAERMRRHMERELARARMRHGLGSVMADVGATAEALVRTLKRTPAGEAIAFETAIEPGLKAAVDSSDLAEILGNLLENAVRHAKAVVRIVAEQRTDGVEVAISDDGPGLSEEQAEMLIGRGRRLDSQGPGAGLGLAIVSDILAANGGALRLSRAADLGGLCVTVTLPGNG